MMSRIKLNANHDFEPIRANQKNDGKTARAIDNLIGGKAVDSQIKVSNRAANLGKLVGELAQMPDIRQEKVAALREQIANGSFNQPAKKIADAILEDERE